MFMILELEKRDLFEIVIWFCIVIIWFMGWVLNVIVFVFCF